MRFLLDTHLLLWAVGDSQRLPSEARRLVEDPGNDVRYSAASIWEIAIKTALRRKAFRVDLPELIATLADMELAELPVTGAHASRVAELPSIHRDPFDRLLVAQSLVEPMTLLTNDGLLAEYGPVVRVV